MQPEWASWKAQSSELRAQLGLPKGAKPWTARPSIALRGVPHKDRVLDLLDIAFASQMKAAPPNTPTRHAISNLVCDISQAQKGKPWAEGLNTARQNTTPYVFCADAIVSGCGMMCLQGWHRGACPQGLFSDSELRSMAGEAYSVPIAALIHFIMYRNPHGLWWRE